MLFVPLTCTHRTRDYTGAFAGDVGIPSRRAVLPIYRCVKSPQLPAYFLIFSIAIIPTVGDAIDALSDLCSELAETFKQIADLSAELAARDHIRVDNIQEVRDHEGLVGTGWLIANY